MPFIPPQYRVATAEESQQIDRKTIEEFGIDGFTLMEIAGSKTASHILDREVPGSHGIFFCGKGNNAGDALVVARYLLQHNIHTSIVFLGGTEDLSPSCSKNFDLLAQLTDKVENGKINIHENWQDFQQKEASYDFIIDGMLGTGLSSRLRGEYPKAVKWINLASLPVYAIDIPTGIHGDTGEVMGAAVRASCTFTYGIHKQGCYLGEGPDHCGEIIFCNLPFPNHLKKESNTFLLDDYLVGSLPNPTPRHKYEAGVLYVLAGSKGLTGAGVLAAKSAWKEGLGAVTVITPGGNLAVYENLLPQIIKKSIGSDTDYYFKSPHLKMVLEAIYAKPGTVLIGPGLGRNPETIQFIHQFLQQYNGNVIIDADAIWALAQQQWQKPKKADWILTPHPGELSQLLQTDFSTGKERLQAVQTMTQQNNITLLSKGFPGIVGTDGGQIYLTDYETRMFSRAGFGDVLAGKIAAARALGYPSLQSVAIGLLSGKNKSRKFSKKNTTQHLEPLDLL